MVIPYPRGAEIDSGHHLVVAEIRLKVALALLVGETGKFGNDLLVSKIQDSTIRNKFRLELRNRFFGLQTHETTTDEEWNHIKVSIQVLTPRLFGNRPSALTN